MHLYQLSHPKINDQMLQHEFSCQLLRSLVKDVDVLTRGEVEFRGSYIITLCSNIKQLR